MGIGILFDIILAFFIASYANSKGRSFGFWFLVSVVLDPIVGFILLQVVSFLSNVFTRQAEPLIVQASPRTVYADEPEHVSSDELYRQSEKLYQQAAKLRELADSIESNTNKKPQKRLSMF